MSYKGRERDGQGGWADISRFHSSGRGDSKSGDLSLPWASHQKHTANPLNSQWANVIFAIFIVKIEIKVRRNSLVA